MLYIWNSLRAWLRGDVSRIVGGLQKIVDKLDEHAAHTAAVAAVLHRYADDTRAAAHANQDESDRALTVRNNINALLGA